MADVIWTAITNTMDYFFDQNAPMTVVIVIMGVSSYLFLKQWRHHVLRPLEDSANTSALLKLQMQIVEDSLDEFHETMYDIYKRARESYLARDASPDNVVVLEMDMQTFMHSLELWGVQGVVENEIRKFFRDNHLAEKTEAEFEIYKDMRKRHLWNRMVKTLNRYWFGGHTNPTRAELATIHLERKEDILATIDEIFIEGRRLAIDFQNAQKKKKKVFSIGDFNGG